MRDDNRLYFCVDGDKPLLQEGIRSILSGEPSGPLVLYPAENCGAEPAILILCAATTNDITPALQRYRTRYPFLKTILLYDRFCAADMFIFLSLGCRCVMKNTLSKNELLMCIQLIQSECFMWSMDSATQLLEETRKYHLFVELMRGEITISAPTARELEIAKCVLSGLDNEEIGKHLYLSAGTVKNNIATILEKYHFRCRSQIISLLAW